MPLADETALQRPLFDPGRRPWTARGPRGLLAGDPPRPVLTVRGILLDGTAARALIDTGIPAEEVVRKGMKIAAEICIYTNDNLVVESIGG